MAFSESVLGYTVFSLLLIIFPSVLYKLTLGRPKKLFPPGPRRRLLIGSLIDIPFQNPWLTFLRWKAQYGDIVYAEALGRGILVLNTLEVVEDLLVNRANNFSDRPNFVMVGELMGLDNSLALLPYGPALKEQRKLCHTALSIEAVRKYHELQQDAAALFLNSILEDPNDFINQLRLTVARIIMSVTYGISLRAPEDDYIAEAEQTMDLISKSTLPGAHLVDLLPPLKYLPAWTPFNSIPRVASAGRKLIRSMVTRPYEHAKREMQPSFVWDCIDKVYGVDGPSALTKDQEHVILWSAGTMYGAGGETTYTSILSFIIAMARHPEVQRKIQDEIDSVVGRDRLPTLQDRQNLPYTEATIKEILRWRPALPLGIARRTRTAEEYKGYWIPEDTIVLPNVWALSVDTTSGIPTKNFAPERFLRGNVPDPESYAFGFGRRVCPGRHLGSNNLFLLVSGLIATVTIGEDRDLDPPYTDGLVSYPHPFKAKFTPRSEEMIAFVREKVAQVV
ncbi:cytochrome P450 [Marasmius fiardii PR-910]|nr:cytochrome P450 [Marasmius fiardii PR-910]